MADAHDEQAIIRVEDLVAGYGERLIFDHVSFEVRRGEVFVILGGSGCGKSTLLKHMIGLYEPWGGHVWIDGDDVVGAEGGVRRRILRKIGVMYQSGALFGSMTLLENVRLPLEEFTDLPPEAMDRIAASKLKLVQLEGFEAFLPAELSGGMKKRAAIARAMALDPALLFLDEPSAGLDPITSAELDDTILRLSRTLGVTFVVVTHELPSIYKIADRVIMLDKERRGIVAIGAPGALRDHAEDPGVRRFFRRESGSEAVA
jgi:phospholipid/cholesterol/gamma-HCH transport system ATP-binding protein